VIVSGDKDFYQLIRDGVCLLNPGRGGPTAVDEEWVDLRNAHERLGVAPERTVDYLALIGDSSDNVPGVRGIGPKTAIQLIEQFGPLEEILARAGRDHREARARGAAAARRRRPPLQAAGHDPHRPARRARPRRAAQCEEPDRPRLREIFLDLEFHSLVRDYAAPERSRRRSARRATTCSPARAGGRPRRPHPQPRAASPSTPRRPRSTRCAPGWSASPSRCEPGEAYYLPFGHTAGTGNGNGNEGRGREPLRRGGDRRGRRFNARLQLATKPAAAAAKPPSLHDPAMAPLVEMLEDEAVGRSGRT
jgi:DNA polymerase I